MAARIMHGETQMRLGSILIPLTILIVGASAALLHGQQSGAREQIGVVLGQPVFRDELDGKSLHTLFLSPVVEKYRQSHREEIEPTEDEIKTAIAFFDQKHAERMKKQEPEFRARLEAIETELSGADLPNDTRKKLELEQMTLETRLRPPGRFFALFVLNHWKFEKHLYDQYGGGRILWQQAGVEAFDAMRNWIKERESKGEFRVTDEKLRESLYEYWTTHNHGAFLTADKDRIQSEFLAPAWASKESPNARAVED